MGMPRSSSGKEKGVVKVIQAEMKQVGFDEVRVDGLGTSSAASATARA